MKKKLKNQKSNNGKNRLILVIASIIFLLDLISKILITSFIEENVKVTIIPGFLSLTNVLNTGAAFSTFENQAPFLILISLICLYIILRMIEEFPNKKGINLSFGLVIGGLLGNLIDRIFHKSVLDFLSFKIFSYNAPIFNLADTAIVVGVFMLLIYTFKEDKVHGDNSKRGRKPKKN